MYVYILYECVGLCVYVYVCAYLVLGVCMYMCKCGSVCGYLYVCICIVLWT